MTQQKGFTLLETLIALVLMSLLIMALFGGFRAGLRSWQAAEQHVAWVEEPRQLSALLYRHFSQFLSVAVGEAAEGTAYLFSGTPERLLYVAPLAMSAGDEPYVFELVNGNNGQSGLWARFTPFLESQTAKELLSAAEYVQISENISVGFMYFYQGAWIDSLPEGQLPELVKVNLHLKTEQSWPSLVFALQAVGPQS